MMAGLCYINLTLVCLVLSFGTQLIGIAIPGWLNVITNTKNTNISDLYENVSDYFISTNFALWYVVICWNGTCQTKSYDQLESDRKKVPRVKYEFEDSLYAEFPFSKLMEFKIEAACALILVLMGLMLVRKLRKWFLLFLSGVHDEHPPLSRFCMLFCYSVISGALILVPSSAFIDVNEDLRDYTDIFQLGVPHALICSTLGGIMALLTSLLLIATMCKSIMTVDTFTSESIFVTVSDAANDNNQLLPLVQPKAQTSTGGFTLPVSPGGASIRKQTVAVLSDSEEHGGKKQLDGRLREDERPPPAYDDCIQTRSTV